MLLALLVFRYNTKDYCFQQAKPQLAANWPKSPPPFFLPFGEILDLHHVTWHNLAKPYFMHHWTSHWGPGRRAPPPSSQNGKNSETGSIHFMQFQATLVQLAEKPPPQQQNRENSETGSIHFIQFQATLVQLAEKCPPPVAKQWKFLRLDLSISCNFKQLWFSWQKSPPPFCLFMRDLAHTRHVEYPWSSYYKSTLRFLLSKFLLQVPNFVNFSIYSHIQKYRTQDHSAGGRPIGSLTTIHTNIPDITVTVLAMALWSVRILYLYACLSLTK